MAAKVVAAMGGAEKIKAVQSMPVAFTENESEGQSTPLTVTIAFPDQIHVDVKTPQSFEKPAAQSKTAQ